MEEQARKKREVKIGSEIVVVDVPVEARSELPKVAKMVEATPEERAVLVRQLLEARRSEVVLFEERFRKSSGGVHGGDGHQKRAFQLLPRHMRRRAMSYNPYLVPLRLRDRAKRESEGTEPPQGYHLFSGGGWRKSRKRIGNRRLDIIRPGPQLDPEALNRLDKEFYENHQFHVLETHLWHAKRFHMINYSGYKIPKQATLRGRRAILHTVKNGTIAVDSSHTRLIVLTSHSLPAISYLLSELSLSPDYLLMPFHLRRLHSCLLQKRISFSPQDGKNSSQPTSIFTPMAPCQIHGAKLQNTGEIRFFIWIDPHAVEEVSKEIQSVIACYQKITSSSISPIEIQISLASLGNRFEFYGPKSGEVLQKVLHPVEQGDKSALAKYLSNRPKCVPAGTTLVVRVKDPRITRYANRFEPGKPASKASQSSVPSLSAMLSNLVLHGGRNGRKNDLSEELAGDSVIDYCPLLAGQFNWCVFKDHETEDIKRIEQIATESHTFVLLQRFPEGEDGQEGWVLTVPTSWGSTFWKKAMRSGARPVGRREVKDLKFENLQPQFPDDFPGTDSYASYALERSRQLSDKWKRRPTQKRLNFQKIGFSSPFHPDWHLLYMNATRKYQTMDHLSHHLYMVYRFADLIEQRLPQIILENEWLHESNGQKLLVLPQRQSSKSTNLYSEQLQQHHIILELTPVVLILESGGTVPTYNAHIYTLPSESSIQSTSDLPIGFVTSSAFCLSRGKACAIAFISRLSFSQSVPTHVLIRNTTSISHHVARLLLMEQKFV